MSVVVEGLSFGYRRGEPIIDGLDAVFESGAVTAVTGRSGRGKSTLLYLVGLLLSPWSGRVSLGDVEDASALDDGARSRLRAERVGFVFQDAALDPSRSVLDNVAEGGIYGRLSRREAEERGRVLLDRFDVGLQVEQRPGEVSGGQAQRVALCRALVNDPDVVLADEPTGNLDVDSARVVIDALVASAHEGGATVIIASHDPVVVASCDGVLEL